MQCTRFKSLRSTTPNYYSSIMSVLSEIASDTHKQKVTKIRSLPYEQMSKVKDTLPVFTPTGIFTHRSIAGLSEYNGVICLDIDHIDDPSDLKNKCKKLSWVWTAFITPSGKGLKVLVKTNATVNNYRQVEIKVSEMFTSATDAIRDNRCKDIARIQFVSYDPEIWINNNSETLNF